MSADIHDLEQGLRTLARLIQAYGEAYWPLFERLEAELKDRQDRAARIAQVLERG